MYPVVDLIDPYVPAERPRFRERFYGFQRKDYIINYLVKEQLMH
jgi:hypothetical protein